MNARIPGRVQIGAAAALMGLALLPFARADTTAADMGRAEFMSACASCHAASAKGDGPVAAALSKKPTDLTTLARRNGGALPVQLVWEMIDGRAQVPLGSFAHGSREMPVWGDEYRATARLSANPAVANNPEWDVRGRIVALIDYLQRVQTK